MVARENAYNQDLFRMDELDKVGPEAIAEALETYLSEYEESFSNPSQIRYFKTFEKGLLSNLDRKTIEPIALALLEEKDVRGFQQFFQRANFSEEQLLSCYQAHLAGALGAQDGFLSVDGSDFPKKGTHSVGVARQYCGRLGKTENCQAGVFLSYATEKGYGLVDRQLYMPQTWFSEETTRLRETCKVPEELRFQTKNEIALEMIRKAVDSGKFPIKWIGCDAAFGSDHNFLRGLPDSVCYFASVRETELVFTQRPDMKVPENKCGRPAKHPRPSIPPVPVKAIASDDAITWEERTLSMGTKGPVRALVKCIRCIACGSSVKGSCLEPLEDVWLYIRKYEDGTVKYFLCNAPETTPLSTLDRLSTMRWSIEQCFQECKSYLGMTHYETRTWPGWHRHMLLVMVAHLFTTVLRHLLQKNSI